MRKGSCGERMWREVQVLLTNWRHFSGGELELEKILRSAISVGAKLMPWLQQRAVIHSAMDFLFCSGTFLMKEFQPDVQFQN